MPITEKQRIGALGEDVACTYLIERGYAVLARNYRKPWGELDIVAQKGKVIHIVEVKTVSRIMNVIHETSDAYEPEDNIHPLKLRRLYRAIMSFLADMGLNEDDIDWQIDSVAVYVERGSDRLFAIEHMEDVG